MLSEISSNEVNCCKGLEAHKRRTVQPYQGGGGTMGGRA